MRVQPAYSLFTGKSCSLPREITVQVRRAELVPLRGILLSAGLENVCSTNVIFQVMKKSMLTHFCLSQSHCIPSRPSAPTAPEDFHPPLSAGP